MDIAARHPAWEIVGPPEIRNPSHGPLLAPSEAEQKTIAESIANLAPIIELAGWVVVPHRSIPIVDPAS